MKAELARTIAAKSQVDGQYSKIIQKITEAAEAGKLECFHYEQINVATLDALVKDGYTVHDLSERNETVIKISWDKGNWNDEK